MTKTIIKYSGLLGIYFLLLLKLSIATNLIQQHLPPPDITPKNPQHCLSSFSPEIDYFPEKAVIQEAKGFKIDYHNSYKIVEVHSPRGTQQPIETYVLLQCGAPVPPHLKDKQIIQVPIQSIITGSTTHLPWIHMLGQERTVKGVANSKYVNTPSIRKRIQEGQIQEVIRGSSINLEQILLLNADLVMSSGSQTEFDQSDKMRELGIQVVFNKEYMEATPLAQSEWILFMAAFYNQEALATSYFQQVSTEYQALAKKVSQIQQRPIVFASAPFQGVWHVPGGESHLAQLVRDAGGNYLWKDLKMAGSTPLAFEVVLSRAQHADFWVNPSSYRSLKAMKNKDYRFALFDAFQNKKVFNNNARLNKHGGNDYWESGIALPHIVLRDLVKLFHPELLPQHQLTWFQALP